MTEHEASSKGFIVGWRAAIGEAMRCCDPMYGFAGYAIRRRIAALAVGTAAVEAGTPALNVPPRTRFEAALAQAEAALRELLVVVEMADEFSQSDSRDPRLSAGVSHARHAAAKRGARCALADIETLRRGGR